MARFFIDRPVLAIVLSLFLLLIGGVRALGHLFPSDKVAYVTPNVSLDECMALMTEKHFRHLPVLDDEGSVLGIISIGDLVKETISDQQFLIAQLEHYIAG